MITTFDSRSQNSQFFSIPGWIPLLMFVLLTFLIGVAGYVIFEQYRESITENEVQNLGAIADLKVAQIVTWREAHRRRSEFFLHGAMLPNEVDQWLDEGTPVNAQKRKILKTLAGLQQEQGYKAVLLLDKNGVTKMSTNGSYVPDTEEKKMAVEAMRSQRVLFSDLHRGSRDGNKITIDCVAPLMATDEKKGAYIVGALLLVIDPDLFLYPMIQSWPTNSLSAETVLTRRDGDHVLFLNEVRHIKDAALALRIPLSNTRLPSTQAILYQLKNMEGVDYRNVPVFAAMRSIPDTPWLMVAKIDKAELFAPIITVQRWVTGLVLAFVAVGGALIFLWFKEHQVRYAHLKAQHDAALERELLLKHFEYLTQYANDIIIIANESGQIVEANERAEQGMGYSREDLLRMRIVELHAPIDSPTIPGKLEKLKQEGALRMEGIYQRKDGSTFPVEISARVIEIQDTRYLQGIIRDITERKHAEDALLKSEKLLKKSQRMAYIGSWERDLANNMFSWSDESCRIFEIDPARFGTSYKAFLDVVHPDDRVMMDKSYTNSLKNRIPFEIVHRLLFPDQRVKYVREWCETDYDQEGNPFRSIGTVQDVTDSMLAEGLIRSSEAALAEFKYTLDQTLDCVFIFQHDTLRFAYVNEGAKGQVGYSEAELLQMTPLDLNPDMTEAYFRFMVQPLLDESLPSLTFETIHRHKDAQEIPVEINLQLVRKAGLKPRFVAIVRDISERRQYEEDQRRSRKLLQELSMHHEAVREEERKRVAREIHDELGQSLLSLKMDVSMLSEALFDASPVLKEKTRAMLELINRTVNSVREISSNLRPAVLDLGLVPALEWLLEEFQRHTVLQCKLKACEDDIQVSDEVATGMFRIVQESLTNVARHAHATKVDISLTAENHVLSVKIKDNGIGIDMGQRLSKKKSFGLTGIEERIYMMGGKFSIEGKQGEGTTLLLTVPFVKGDQLHDQILIADEASDCACGFKADFSKNVHAGEESVE